MVYFRSIKSPSSLFALSLCVPGGFYRLIFALFFRMIIRKGEGGGEGDMEEEKRRGGER